MIRDYERGSGYQGAVRSLIGERVVAALTLPSNTIILCFESGGGIAFRAWDFGAVALRPMSVEDTVAAVKEQMRDADRHQANLVKALQHLGDMKHANKPKAGYVSTGHRDVDTTALD